MARATRRHRHAARLRIAAHLRPQPGLGPGLAAACRHEGERQGLDLYELGAGAYPEFVTHTEEFTQRYGR